MTQAEREAEAGIRGWSYFLRYFTGGGVAFLQLQAIGRQNAVSEARQKLQEAPLAALKPFHPVVFKMRGADAKIGPRETIFIEELW